MQFNEYIEFTRLCRKYDPAVELDYLIAGLISEVGEVVGVEAKYIRGDYDRETYLSRLQSELGDVAWMFFRLVDNLYVESGLDTVEKVLNCACTHTSSSLPVHSNSTITDVGLRTLDNVSSFYYAKEDKDKDIYKVEKLYVYFIYLDLLLLCDLAETNLEEVISKNVTKLKERLFANTIKGDGEHR